MKKIFFTLLLAATTLFCQAQTEATQPTLRFGYLSYNAVLQAMPAYTAVQNDMAQLREQYEAEQKRVEDDFNRKYEEFLDGQRDFPTTILQKRQSELQELLDKNVAFKKESQRLLAKAQTEAEAPLRNMLADALAKVGSERQLAFIINTDTNAAPWLNVQLGEDVTEAVLAAIAQ